MDIFSRDLLIWNTPHTDKSQFIFTSVCDSQHLHDPQSKSSCNDMEIGDVASKVLKLIVLLHSNIKKLDGF